MAWIQARVLVKQGSQEVYNVIPKFQEQLILNYVINIKKFIFKVENLQDNYIKLCKLRTCMEMQKKSSMTIFCSKNLLKNSKKLYLKWKFSNNFLNIFKF
jgi:hypothetical protein